MIPTVKYNAIGIPYHGPVEGTTLTLPNNATKTVPLQEDGAVYVIKNPSAPGITRSSEEQTQDNSLGREWRTYALITSANRLIAGKSLGKNSWLYCDGNGTPWLVSASIVVDNSTQATITLTLKSLFGRVSTVNTYSPINATLDTLTLSSTQVDLTSCNEIDVFTTGDLGIDHDSTGANAAFNIYTANVGGYQGYQKYWYATKYIALKAYCDIEITGNGSTDPATLGNGITGTITFGANASTFNTQTLGSKADTFLTYGSVMPNLGSGCAAIYDTNGPLIPGSGDCYEYIITHNTICRDYNYSDTRYQTDTTTYSTKMRRVYNGDSAGWVEVSGYIESGDKQDISLSGKAVADSKNYFSYYPDEVCRLTGNECIVVEDSARSGSIRNGAYYEHNITLTTPSGSAVSNYVGYTSGSVDNANNTPFDASCNGGSGFMSAGTWTDDVTGELATVEILNGRCYNLRTSSQQINAVTPDGGAITNVASINVSYQPEIDEWATGSSVTSWL